jgi:DNA-binding Lrp family transcriptional regulator
LVFWKLFFYEEACLSTNSPVIESSTLKLQRSAYIFINTEPEAIDSILEDLRQIEFINEVYPSKGAYDIIAKASGDSTEYLREQIFARIKNLPTIKSMLTLMIVEPEK